jgi:DNA modification methylase
MISLIHGDCLEKMKDIPDGSIDLVLTDPPYGTTACKWDSVIPFEPMWEQLKRITKKNGAICLFGSEPFSSALRMSNIKMFKYDWIWDKRLPSNIFQAKYQPLRQHELISVFGGRNYYPQKTDIEKTRSYKDKYGGGETFNKRGTGEKIHTTKGKFPKSIQTFTNAIQKGKVHPTQKPVALLEYLIKTYTLEGETVLDFTMGSGSTGVACKNLNRNFIGIEKDADYFETARKRINGES